MNFFGALRTAPLFFGAGFFGAGSLLRVLELHASSSAAPPEAAENEETAHTGL